MAATHLGTINQQGPGATTEYSADGLTHTVVVQMTRAMAEVRSNHPAFNSTLNVQDAVVRLVSFTIAYEPGDLATVTYRYTGNDGGNTADPNNGISGAVGIGSSESYELDVSLEQQSLLRWAIKKHTAMSIEDIAVLRKMIQEGTKNEDGSLVSSELSSNATGSGARAVATKIEKDGITSYLTPVFVWKRKRSTASWQPSGQIGKISQPQGPAPSISGNWLYMGSTASGAGNTADAITDTWQSSPLGDKWDEQIYE